MIRSITTYASALVLMTLSVVTAQDEVVRVIAMPTPEELEDVGQPQGVVIDDDFLRAWRKHRDMAIAQGATVIILEITTPGGSLATTYRLVEDLENLRREHEIRTVAFVPHHATSAGAIIAIACQELVMVPGATVGNALPIHFSDVGSYREAPRKIVGELVKVTDRIARSGRFNEEILRALVDADLELWAVWGDAKTQFLSREELEIRYPPETRERHGIRTRMVVGRSHALSVQSGGDLSTIPGFDGAFPVVQVRSRTDLLRGLNLADRDLASDEVLVMPPPKGLGYFVHLFGNLDWTLLLLFAGIACFVLELKTPGLGVFGVLGILSLVGYFVAHAGDGLPVALSAGLLILGFFLILTELFIIPGFGVAGISGIILVIFSIYTATIGLSGETVTDRLIPDSDGDWVIVQAWLTTFLAMLVVGVAGAFVAARSLHRLPLIGSAFVSPSERMTGLTQPGGVTPHGKVEVHLGARGLADTDLRPAGRASFGTDMLDVVSEGGWVRKGVAVEVVLVEGHRVVVAPADTAGGPDPAANPEGTE